MDPVDLLCRRSNAPIDLLNTNVSQRQGFLPQGSYPSQYPVVQPIVPPMPTFFAAPMPASPQGPAGPPGLDRPQAYSTLSTLQPGFEDFQQPAPSPPAAPPMVHAWALEAKIKAEQAQASQRQWAEKMQRQYIQGQTILNALQEKEDAGRPEESQSAFDRLVRQMGLQNETPRCTGQREPVAGKTPPSKQQAAEPATPPKVDLLTQLMGARRTGEKENNLLSPAASRRSKRAGRNRAQTTTYH